MTDADERPPLEKIETALHELLYLSEDGPQARVNHLIEIVQQIVWHLQGSTR